MYAIGAVAKSFGNVIFDSSAGKCLMRYLSFLNPYSPITKVYFIALPNNLLTDFLGIQMVTQSPWEL